MEKVISTGRPSLSSDLPEFYSQRYSPVVHSTRYTVHGTRYTVLRTQYTVNSIQYTVHSTIYNQYSTA